MQEILIVFIHGYSVTSFETYGELPQRLINEAKERGMAVATRDVFLGRYVSFSDQVKLSDVSRALQAAIEEQIPEGRTFVCITHSTGGPLARHWFHHYYREKEHCPMSHLIMLAPANHGSALAQLGKSRLSRLRSWLDGVEAGQGILDWLELGSDESITLNQDWIRNGAALSLNRGLFPFVIMGQDIDRKLYDHINSYTGEPGSDGVVRVASANLNNHYIRLEQRLDLPLDDTKPTPLQITEHLTAAETPFRVLRKRSHSGDSMGIMRSVKKETQQKESRELIECIFDCMAVKDKNSYRALTNRFRRETEKVQKESKIEFEKKSFRSKLYIHDRYSMLIFRVHDTDGNMIPDFDLVLTAENNDPDLLPTGFFLDRQMNHVSRTTITYYLNYDVLNGTAEIRDEEGELVRRAITGSSALGIQIHPRPVSGFVRYAPCSLSASAEFLGMVVKPNATTIIDIHVKRIIGNEIFRLEQYNENKMKLNFKNTPPGAALE